LALEGRMVGGRACSATVCFRPHQLPQPPGAAYPTKQHLISRVRPVAFVTTNQRRAGLILRVGEDPRTSRPSPLTDPNERDSRIRFFMAQLRAPQL
jgi:hypothetical protein